jgi:TetR/AcrR family transcriptional regulator, transcriptional repressor for nem operon
MPHPPHQKAETRKRILRSARRLFNRSGFAAVSIDDIMADAGLTRGGFYKHFGTKEELYAEAITVFAAARRPGSAKPGRRRTSIRQHKDLGSQG